LLCAVRGKRYRDAVALCKTGTQTTDGFELLGRFHALCDGVQPKNATERDNCFDELQTAAFLIEIADEAADVTETVKPKSLERWSTDELEAAICAGMFDSIQRYEAERILRQRESAPDRKLARRIYNNAAWALAFSFWTFIVALGIFWLLATDYKLP
jgi:acyl transferase domain-containing protein